MGDLHLAGDVITCMATRVLHLKALLVKPKFQVYRASPSPTPTQNFKMNQRSLNHGLKLKISDAH